MEKRKDVMASLDDDLLKPTDLARRLRVSRSWVYDAAKAGRIPCVRLGGPDGPLRFVRGDLEHWLENARCEWLPGQSTSRNALSPRSTSPQLMFGGLADDAAA